MDRWSRPGPDGPKLVCFPTVGSRKNPPSCRDAFTFVCGGGFIPCPNVNPLVPEALLKLTQPKAVVVEIRDFVPFPFRYACLDSDTKSLPWGGHDQPPPQI